MYSWLVQMMMKVINTATRAAESVLEEDQIVDEECSKLSIKRKNPETRDKIGKTNKEPKTHFPSFQLEGSSRDTQEDQSDTHSSLVSLDQVNDINLQVKEKGGYSFFRIRCSTGVTPLTAVGPVLGSREWGAIAKTQRP